MSALSDLIARVEGLKGPDRETDKLVEDTLWPNINFLPFNPNPNDWLVKIGEKWVETVRYPRGVMTNKDRYVSRYTASIDAVVALIERELPGWMWSLSGDTGEYDACLSTEDGRFLISEDIERYGEGPNGAIALLLGALRALDAIAQRNGGKT